MNFHRILVSHASVWPRVLKEVPPPQIFSLLSLPSFLLFTSLLLLTLLMPSANPRIIIPRFPTKPSSLASPLILESCSAMPRPRVTLSTLERSSARATMNAPPRSQPLPAASRLTTQVRKRTSEAANTAAGHRARAAAVLAEHKQKMDELDQRRLARQERARQLALKHEESRRQRGE